MCPELVEARLSLDASGRRFQLPSYWMREIVYGLAMLAAVCCAGCSGQGRSLKADEVNTIEIKFPDGYKIRAEMMVRLEDIMKGMKFRDSLAEDRGMIFMYAKEGNYPHWMHEVLVPLDLIWLDRNRRIVQLIHKAPPCPGPKEQCLSYGGQFRAIYVLEVPSGIAARHGLKPGMQLDF